MFQKKSLGQNFLNSKKAISDIVTAGEISSGETVLEAGPGMGVLTEALLKAGAKVIAIEKDRRLIPVLMEKFSTEIASGALTLIEDDILNFDFSRYTLSVTRYKLIANIPYYITGQFLRKFLETDSQPSKIVLLIQKEVAERIIAADKKESILSVSVKIYGEPRYINTVKAGSFSPAPNVDSAIISISNISKKNFTEFSEKTFFEVVKTGFSHKRKQLAGNLKELIPNIVNELEKMALTKDIRAEDLPISAWSLLAKTSTK